MYYPNLVCVIFGNPEIVSWNQTQPTTSFVVGWVWPHETNSEMFDLLVLYDWQSSFIREVQVPIVFSTLVA